MDVRWSHEARDCGTEPKDWATIGARILRAAALASAAHLAEQAQQLGEQISARLPVLKHGRADECAGPAAEEQAR
jgi:hypothetical protein